MAESTVIRTKRDALITVTDGTNTYTVAREVGDFKFDVPRQGILLNLDRGSMGSTPSLRLGDDQPMTLGWTQFLTDLGGGTSYQTILDLLLELLSGYTLTSWTSTLGNQSDVKTWTVKWTVDGASFGESDKTYTFAFVTLRGSVAEGDPNTVTVTGTSYQLKPTLS